MWAGSGDQQDTGGAVLGHAVNRNLSQHWLCQGLCPAASEYRGLPGTGVPGCNSPLVMPLTVSTRQAVERL